MRSISVAKIAEEIVKWFARVGIPQEILTDQGTNFMSGILRGVCMTLKIHQ